MIKSIKLNSCSPYQISEISDCKKINFVFGANGSGKSTISSFLSGEQNQRFQLSSIVWTGENHEKIEVYNKAFRQTNLQKDMQGIFTIGSATIEEIKEMESLKIDLQQKANECEGINNTLQRKTDEKNEKERAFIEDAWYRILKKNEDDFKEAFGGLRGSKEKFFVELKKRINGIPNHKGTICNRQDLIQRAKTLYNSSNLEKCNRLELNSEKLENSISEIINNSIWNTVIVGNEDIDISTLIKELDNSSWVSQGRKYIKDSSRKCPFCQQETINEEFLNKLEQYFDREYNNKVNQMSQLYLQYKDYAQQIIGEIDLLINDNEISIKIGNLSTDILLAKKNEIETIVSRNYRKIEEKQSEPGRKIAFESIKNHLREIQDMLATANILIDNHNNLVNQKDTEKITLCDDIWATCIQEEEILIKNYKTDISNLEKGIIGISKQLEEKRKVIERLKNEVDDKGKNITSVQPTIDEINRSLKAYGFNSFSIQPAEGKENYYCIKRDDGTNAINTLSEGEETFLTFLYFMQRVKGSTNQSHISDKKIVVLDDPISSLDSTILYVVGAMVKDLSKKIRDGKGDVTQLFVLTHNVFFHKEASFIDGRTKELNDVNYWMIKKNNGDSKIESFGMKNPISTSYELLWKEIKDYTETSSLISIQNTMRRIIENYFGMLGGKKDDYLINKFESVEERMIARSLLYWINDGSHSIPDDLFIDPYTDAVPRYKKVFRDIFDKSGNLAHYNMMMGIEGEMAESTEEQAK